ncbi:MAG: GGDEF domain-containing protein [Herpetosiphonaceae bacterium]|nr:GGDEF domain-containing protein [Herpetosiphonaceae bacterium]
MATNEKRINSDQDSDVADRVPMWGSVLGRSPRPIAITTGETHIVRFVNAAFVRRHVEARTLLLRSFGDCFPEVKDDGVGAVLDEVFSSGEPQVVASRAHSHAEHDGTVGSYIVWPILDEYEEVVGLVLQIDDPSEQVLARRRADQTAVEPWEISERLLLAGLREQARAETAWHRALHDQLTGLPNRGLFLDRLEQVLPANHRDPSPFAVLLLDVDRFKTVNDTFGHAAGDHFLQEIARRLSSCIRPDDTVARFGGDEFALLLVEVRGVSEAIHIADRIHQCLSEPFDIDGHTILSNASIGIMLSTSQSVRPDELLRDADIALYRAKALGKGRYVIFDPVMNEQAQELVRVEAELHHAIEREELRR